MLLDHDSLEMLGFKYDVAFRSYYMHGFNLNFSKSDYGPMMSMFYGSRHHCSYCVEDGKFMMPHLIELVHKLDESIRSDLDAMKDAMN